MAIRSCFNEAPALHGGKRGDGLTDLERIVASMRPPHYTGENGNFFEVSITEYAASMRPPHYTGENATAGDPQSDAP